MKIRSKVPRCRVVVQSFHHPFLSLHHHLLQAAGQKNESILFFPLKKQGFHGIKIFSAILLMKVNCFSSLRFPMKNRIQFAKTSKLRH